MLGLDPHRAQQASQYSPTKRQARWTRRAAIGVITAIYEKRTDRIHAGKVSEFLKGYEETGFAIVTTYGEPAVLSATIRGPCGAPARQGGPGERPGVALSAVSAGLTLAGISEVRFR